MRLAKFTGLAGGIVYINPAVIELLTEESSAFGIHTNIWLQNTADQEASHDVQGTMEEVAAEINAALNDLPQEEAWEESTPTPAEAGQSDERKVTHADDSATHASQQHEEDQSDPD